MGKVKQLQKMFRDYYENILTEEIVNRKTEKGKQKYRDILDTNLKFIDRNEQALYFTIASHVSLGNAKNFLIQKLSQIQNVGSNYLRLRSKQGLQPRHIWPQTQNDARLPLYASFHCSQ